MMFDATRYPGLEGVIGLDWIGLVWLTGTLFRLIIVDSYHRQRQYSWVRRVLLL